MNEHLISNLWYTIAAITDCDVETHNGVTIHLPAGIQYFHFADADSIYISGQYKLTQNPPLFKPASAAALGGGYIESNLHIGHTAADAVAAQCTLTLGDLAAGGILADSNGQRVELEDPHKYAVGYLAFRDATEACTLTIGEWSKSWDEMKDAKASGTFLVMGDEGTISVSGIQVSIPNDPADDAAWNAAFSAAECGIVCTAVDQHGEIDVSVEAAEVGEAGNCIVISVENYEPVTLAGGSTARTKQDVVDAIASDADCPVNATLDADEGTISLTAKEYGEDYDVNAEGDMFSNWSDVEGGHGDYTVAELVTAISGAFDDITPTAGETEGTITLTANTPGAAANAIEYTATGCFGCGAVKQGSTTRGRNAVTQTSFKIYLNGEELDVEPAPQPTALTPTTAMRNGGVYTVAADIDAQLITLPANATAEIWVTNEAFPLTVAWPHDWYWLDGTSSGEAAWGERDVPPPMDVFCTRYCVEVSNNGDRVVARVKYAAPLEGWEIYDISTDFVEKTTAEVELTPVGGKLNWGTGKCSVSKGGEIVAFGHAWTLPDKNITSNESGGSTPPRSSTKMFTGEVWSLGGAVRIRIEVTKPSYDGYSGARAFLAATSAGWDSGQGFAEMEAPVEAYGSLYFDTVASAASAVLSVSPSGQGGGVDGRWGKFKRIAVYRGGSSI